LWRGFKAGIGAVLSRADGHHMRNGKMKKVITQIIKEIL